MLDFSVTFIITIINITILFLILRAILFKPVTKFMADRAKSVQDSIEQADKDKAQAKALLAEYEDKLKNAEAEGQKIVKAAREDAERQVQMIIAEGKQEAADFSAATRKQLEAEHQVALAKFRLEAAALVMAASAKLAARDLSGDDNRRYVNMLLDELVAKKGSG
jgi:F-type H+-transporting ATPase subunit b